MTTANYSLIHWEDADPSTAGWLRITGAKEGPLTYCSPHKQTYFGGVSVATFDRNAGFDVAADPRREGGVFLSDA